MDHLHVEHMSIASLETQHPVLELTWIKSDGNDDMDAM
jgi:hypothetical protein